MDFNIANLTHSLHIPRDEHCLLIFMKFFFVFVTKMIMHIKQFFKFMQIEIFINKNWKKKKRIEFE